MPWVASAACWRKTVEFEDEDEVAVVGDCCLCCCCCCCDGRGNCKISIGIESLWHAKMAFMMGMYWCARSVEGETETSKIRDCRALVFASEVDETTAAALVVVLVLVLIPSVVVVMPISDSA